MKYKIKDIKKLGRTYGKHNFKLTDADAQDKIVLDMIEKLTLLVSKTDKHMDMLSATKIYDRQGFRKSIICSNVF